MKKYGTISICNTDFEDYWNLAEHPLYVTLDKKNKKYFRYKEIATVGYTRVNSLGSLKIFLNNSPWCYGTKKWQIIAREIDAVIGIPFVD